MHRQAQTSLTVIAAIAKWLTRESIATPKEERGRMTRCVLFVALPLCASVISSDAIAAEESEYLCTVRYQCRWSNGEKSELRTADGQHKKQGIAESKARGIAMMNCMALDAQDTIYYGGNCTFVPAPADRK